MTDLEYVVEASTDLQTWCSDPSDVEEVLMPTAPGDFETKCYRTVRPMTQAPAQFLRVRVIYQP